MLRIYFWKCNFLAASIGLAEKLVSCQDKPELQKIVTDAKKEFGNDYKKLLSYIVEVNFYNSYNLFQKLSIFEEKYHFLKFLFKASIKI